MIDTSNDQNLYTLLSFVIIIFIGYILSFFVKDDTNTSVTGKVTVKKLKDKKEVKYEAFDKAVKRGFSVESKEENARSTGKHTGGETIKNTEW